MESGKAVGSSGVMSEMVNAAGEAWVDMITALVNMIIVGVIPAEWELSTFVNCLRGKEILQKAETIGDWN